MYAMPRVVAGRDTRRDTRAVGSARLPARCAVVGKKKRARWRNAPNFVRLALGLRSFNEPVGVRGDHGARHERGQVLHDRGSRRGALWRPRARLADNRHGVTLVVAKGRIRCPGIRQVQTRGACDARCACVSLERAVRRLSGVGYLTRFVSNVRTVRARAVRSTRRISHEGNTPEKLRLFTPVPHLTLNGSTNEGFRESQTVDAPNLRSVVNAHFREKKTQ